MAIRMTAVLLLVFLSAFAQEKRNVTPLPLDFSLQELNQVIIPGTFWDPYPGVFKPSNIKNIPYHIRESYIHAAEKLMPVEWAPLPADVFLEYQKTGNRSNYERLSFKRRENLATLVLAEVFERKGRFTNQIINGIWALCEESFWGVPAHLFLQKAGSGLPDITDPVVDLFAAETAAEIAWIYYLLKPELNQVSPLITARIRHEVNERIFLPFLKHTDWTYLGFKWKQNPDSLRRVNNWNPWINANVLTATLILSEGNQRNQLIHKTLESINNFIIPFPADGGSDEGPEYWGRAAGSLFDYLELLKSASGGKIDLFDLPLIRNMGAYIYKVYIKGDYFLNYGDADAKIKPEPALLYRYGKQINNDTLTRFAAFLAKGSPYGKETLYGSFGVLNRALPALAVLKELLAAPAMEPLLRDVWLPDVQVMAARSETNSSAGFYLAVKGGNNAASHNHNDVGNLIVYTDGNPLLIDAGALEYTSQTFGDRRYELWNNQSAYHNLPVMNGFMQKAGKEFCAQQVHYRQNNRAAVISMDIAAAYPAEAGVISWKREVRLERKKEIIIKDTYQLNKLIQPFTENFLTPLFPDISQSGVVYLTDGASGRKYGIYYNAGKFIAQIDTIPIVEEPSAGGDTGRMTRIWGNCLYRVRLIATTDLHSDTITIAIR